jgi:hypothetical protein
MNSELKKAIAALIAYNRDEKRAWEQSVLYDKEPGYKLSEYDPALCPGHIYHTIRKLEQFIK